MPRQYARRRVFQLARRAFGHHACRSMARARFRESGGGRGLGRAGDAFRSKGRAFHGRHGALCVPCRPQGGRRRRARFARIALAARRRGDRLGRGHDVRLRCRARDGARPRGRQGAALHGAAGHEQHRVRKRRAAVRHRRHLLFAVFRVHDIRARHRPGHATDPDRPPGDRAGGRQRGVARQHDADVRRNGCLVPALQRHATGCLASLRHAAGRFRDCVGRRSARARGPRPRARARRAHSMPN